MIVRKRQKLRKNKRSVSEEQRLLLSQFAELLNRLGVEVRFEKGDFRSGTCIIQETRTLLIVNKAHDFEKQLGALIDTIRQFEFNQIYMPPNLRLMLEGQDQESMGGL